VCVCVCLLKLTLWMFLIACVVPHKDCEIQKHCLVIVLGIRVLSMFASKLMCMCKFL